MTEFERFVQEKSQLEGKDPEDFAREMAYQVEMWTNLPKERVHEVTREQLEEMYADMNCADGLDHQETEADKPSKLIWSWHKEAQLPRRGHLDDSV